MLKGRTGRKSELATPSHSKTDVDEEGDFCPIFAQYAKNGAMCWFELGFGSMHDSNLTAGCLSVISSVYKHQWLFPLSSSALSNILLLDPLIYQPLNCIQHLYWNVKNLTCSLYLASLALQITQGFDYGLTLSRSRQTQLNSYY